MRFLVHFCSVSQSVLCVADFCLFSPRKIQSQIWWFAHNPRKNYIHQAHFCCRWWPQLTYAHPEKALGREKTNPPTSTSKRSVCWPFWPNKVQERTFWCSELIKCFTLNKTIQGKAYAHSVRVSKIFRCFPPLVDKYVHCISSAVINHLNLTIWNSPMLYQCTCSDQFCQALLLCVGSLTPPFISNPSL